MATNKNTIGTASTTNTITTTTAGSGTITITSKPLGGTATISGASLKPGTWHEMIDKEEFAAKKRYHKELLGLIDNNNTLCNMLSFAVNMSTRFISSHKENLSEEEYKEQLEILLEYNNARYDSEINARKYEEKINNLMGGYLGYSNRGRYNGFLIPYPTMTDYGLYNSGTSIPSASSKLYPQTTPIVYNQSSANISNEDEN